MVQPWVPAADSSSMDVLPPTAERRTAIVRRNRIYTRVTMLGNVIALAATATTGILTGVLAQQAQAADLAKAQAKADAEAAAKRAAPAPVKLVPKPIRTVKVLVPSTTRRTATTRRSTSTSTSSRTSTTSSYKAPTTTTTTTTATKSSGS